MAQQRCEFTEDWYSMIGYKRYYRKARCKATATTLFSDNPRIYAPPLKEHRYCEDHAAVYRTNAGMIERGALAPAR